MPLINTEQYLSDLNAAIDTNTTDPQQQEGSRQAVDFFANALRFLNDAGHPVGISTFPEDSQLDDSWAGYYSAEDKLIYLPPASLNFDDIVDVSRTLAHESLHALDHLMYLKEREQNPAQNPAQVIEYQDGNNSYAYLNMKRNVPGDISQRTQTYNDWESEIIPLFTQDDPSFANQMTDQYGGFFAVEVIPRLLEEHFFPGNLLQAITTSNHRDLTSNILNSFADFTENLEEQFHAASGNPNDFLTNISQITRGMSQQIPAQTLGANVQVTAIQEQSSGEEEYSDHFESDNDEEHVNARFRPKKNPDNLGKPLKNLEDLIENLETLDQATLALKHNSSDKENIIAAPIAAQQKINPQNIR